MKKIFYLFLLFTLSISSCSKFDDIEIKDKLEELDSRLKDLENQIKAVNELLQAQDAKLYIKEVVYYSDGFVLKMSDNTNIDIPYAVAVIPTIGKNGNWYIYGKDSGIKADNNDGITPIVGDNGNWWIADTDTAIKATVVDGKDAPTIVQIVNKKSEMVFYFSDGTNMIINIEGDTRFFGNINIYSQKGFDAFMSNGYTQIIGDISLKGDIDILTFENIEYIGGNLIVLDNSIITNFENLQSLTNIDGKLNLSNNINLNSLINNSGNEIVIGGGLKINENPSLINLSGISLSPIVSGSIIISYNDKLESIESLKTIEYVKGGFELINNKRLINLNGLNSLKDIEDNLAIVGCNQLANLIGLDVINKVKTLYIGSNSQMRNLDGIESLEFVTYYFSIDSNPILSEFCALSNDLISSLSSIETVYIIGNKFNPLLDMLSIGICTEEFSLYVVGSHTGWNPINSIKMNTKYKSLILEQYFYLKDNDEFKVLTSQDSWIGSMGDNPDKYGFLTGDINTQKNILSNESGYYYYTVDRSNLTWVLQEANWGVVGSSTPNGWNVDNDTDMIYDPINKNLTVTTDLVEGVFKFSKNNSWAGNLGSSASENYLVYEGGNIVISEAGNYTIKLNIGISEYGSTSDYNYELIKN